MDKDQDKQLLSEELSKFIGFLEYSKKEYVRCKADFDQLEKRKIDCLHLIELKCTQPEDCTKVSMMLQHCLLERRKCKDTIAILEPLVQFWESEREKLLMN